MLVVLYAVIREKGKGVHVWDVFFFLMCFWVVLSCSVFVQKTYKTFKKT